MERNYLLNFHVGKYTKLALIEEKKDHKCRRLSRRWSTESSGMSTLQSGDGMDVGKGLGKNEVEKGTGKEYLQDCGSLRRWLCHFRTHSYFFLRKFLSLSCGW